MYLINATYIATTALKSRPIEVDSASGQTSVFVGRLPVVENRSTFWAERYVRYFQARGAPTPQAVRVVETTSHHVTIKYEHDRDTRRDRLTFSGR